MSETTARRVPRFDQAATVEQLQVSVDVPSALGDCDKLTEPLEVLCAVALPMLARGVSIDTLVRRLTRDWPQSAAA